MNEQDNLEASIYAAAFGVAISQTANRETKVGASMEKMFLDRFKKELLRKVDEKQAEEMASTFKNTVKSSLELAYDVFASLPKKQRTFEEWQRRAGKEIDVCLGLFMLKLFPIKVF